MSLDMSGTIDSTFQSTPAQRMGAGGGYVNGVWNDALGAPEPYTVTLQALSDKELAVLAAGGERVTDVRRVYINDGDLQSLTLSDHWTFDDVNGTFRVVKLDNRPWRNYCKLIVSKIDES